MFDISAVIFVLDSNNKDRLQEAYNELAKLVQEKELKEASLLIFANKQVSSWSIVTVKLVNFRTAKKLL